MPEQHDQLLHDLAQLAAWLSRHGHRHPDQQAADQAFILTVGQAIGRIEAFDQLAKNKHSDAIGQVLVALVEKLGKMETRIMHTLDETLEVVKANKTLIGGLKDFIAGLRKQIADALSGAALSPENQAKVDAVFDGATEEGAAITEALTTGTPASNP